MPSLPMRFRRFAPVLILFALLVSPLRGESLQAAFQKAGPGLGYDKHLVLDTGTVYTGGLLIGDTFNRITAQFGGPGGQDVLIEGNGAILDLEGQELSISYCTNRLDVSDLVMLNGNIRYRGVNSGTLKAQPTGSVRYVTFYGPHDYGVRIFGAGQDILVERNLFVGAVDTGPDFNYITGYSSVNLPTGGNVCFSGFYGTYGIPVIHENWSYHPDPAANNDLIRHFMILCEYG